MKNRILICEQDLGLANALLSYFSDHYEVALAPTTHSALPIIENFDPDIIITSFYDENSDTHPFRLVSNAGIIFLCDHLNSNLENHLFQIGGDHLLVKPFQLDSLELRMKSVFRLRSQSKRKSPTLMLGPIMIQPFDRTVKISGEIITLPPMHFDLLLAFANHPDRLLSRNWLRQNIWKDNRVSLRTVDAHISKLKKQIPQLNQFIFNVYGEGYLFSLNRKAI